MHVYMYRQDIIIIPCTIFFSFIGSGQTSECGPFNWLVCNSDMVVCSDLCGPDVMTTQCAMCLGDSYGRHCASCHSQIVAPALNQTALGTP